MTDNVRLGKHDGLLMLHLWLFALLVHFPSVCVIQEREDNQREHTISFHKP